MPEQKGPERPQGPSIKVSRGRRRIYQQAGGRDQSAGGSEQPARDQPEKPPARPRPRPKRAAASKAKKPAAQSPAASAAAQTAAAEPEAPPPPAVQPAAGDEQTSPDLRELEPAGRRLTNRYMAMAMGAGLIPVPVVDSLALGALQLLLIRDMARLYGAEFSPTRGRVLLATLLGSVGTVSVATGYLVSLVKLVPLVGYSAGAATMPALSGAATFALGRVFQRHFATGGDLWDFDPGAKAREMADAMAEGRRRAVGGRRRG